MTNKPNLVLITTTPITQVPRESFDEFKHWVLVDGLKPSAALRKFMDKYQCPKPDSSIPIELIKYTYPDFDISSKSFTFKIHDSGYPYILTDFNDNDFDQLIQEILLSGW